MDAQMNATTSADVVNPDGSCSKIRQCSGSRGSIVTSYTLNGMTTQKYQRWTISLPKSRADERSDGGWWVLDEEDICGGEAPVTGLAAANDKSRWGEWTVHFIGEPP